MRLQDLVFVCRAAGASGGSFGRVVTREASGAIGGFIRARLTDRSARRTRAAIPFTGKGLVLACRARGAGGGARRGRVSARDTGGADGGGSSS